MKLKTTGLVLTLLTFISISTPAYADTLANSPEKIVSQKNYEKSQISDSIINKMALDGLLVNNENTTVDVYDQYFYKQDDSTSTKEIAKIPAKIVKIKKLLNQQVLNDGTTVDNYSVSLTANIKDDSAQTQSLAIPQAQLATTGTSGTKVEYPTNYTVNLSVGFNYDRKSFDGASQYRANTYFSSATLTDNRFTLYQLSQSITASGMGYTPSGTPTTISESNYKENNYPTSGTVYSSPTGFVNYLYPNDGSGLGSGVNIDYQRVDTGTIYSSYFSITL